MGICDIFVTMKIKGLYYFKMHVPIDVLYLRFKKLTRSYLMTLYTEVNNKFSISLYKF